MMISQPRSRSRVAYDTFAAYFRLDAIEEFSFPANLVFRYVALSIPVFMYFFQARFLNAQDQFAATLIGVSVAAGLAEALSGFTNRLTYAQERGILETYLVEPVPWTLVPLAMNVWKSLMGMVVTVLMLGIGWALGASLSPIGFLPFILVLVLGSLACNAIGVFAGSFILLFKRGDPVMGLYTLAATLLGGALFPISYLPGWIRWVSYLLPHSYVIGAQRAILIPGDESFGVDPVVAVVALCLFTVVAFVLGLWTFGLSLRVARTRGLLIA